jgi:hypothetical protein
VDILFQKHINVEIISYFQSYHFINIKALLC